MKNLFIFIGLLAALFIFSCSNSSTAKNDNGGSGNDQDTAVTGDSQNDGIAGDNEKKEGNDGIVAEGEGIIVTDGDIITSEIETDEDSVQTGDSDVAITEGTVDSDFPMAGDSDIQDGYTAPDADTAVVLDCKGLLQCNQKCDTDDPANCKDKLNCTCKDACKAKTASGEQAKYDTLVTCYINNCVGSTDNQCVVKKCPSEYNACMYHTDAPVYGTLSGSCEIKYMFIRDANLQTKMAEHDADIQKTAAWTGTYGTAGKIPPEGAYTTEVFGMVDGGNQIIIVQATIDSGLGRSINEVVMTLPVSATVAVGDVNLDYTKQNQMPSIFARKHTGSGAQDYCVIGIVLEGKISITAVNNPYTEGGTTSANFTGFKLYYPTQTPLGDISSAFSPTPLCPKE